MDHRTLSCATALLAGCLLLAGCSAERSPSGAGSPEKGIASSTVIDGTTVDPVEDSHLDKTPPRKLTGLVLRRVGWTYDCMECHRLLKARWHHEPLQGEHQNLVLDHGANRFCLNCHHPTNRNAFVDYDGSEIAKEDVVLLCAKCHGPTYRDWKMGVHGRRNGYWNAAMGPQTRLICIQCHDPHSPRFKPMRPLPGPHYPPRAAGALHDEGDDGHASTSGEDSGAARAHGAVSGESEEQ